MSDRDDKLDAEIALLRVQHALAVWKKPLISNDEAPVALGIGQTMWQLLKLEGEAPPCVMIGRRVFYRPEDLQQWIYEMAAKKNAGEDAGVQVEAATC